MEKQKIYNDLEILQQAPMLIKLAKEIIQYLPKGEERDSLIKILLDVKRDLIKLDVCIQDIEWSIAQREMEKKEIYK